MALPKYATGFKSVLFSALLFLLFWEWLRPLFMLSKHTDLYIMEPFVLAIVGFLAVDLLKVSLVWNGLLKLLIVLQTLSYFFKWGLPFQMSGWQQLFSTLGEDVLSIVLGQWLDISSELRTFLFLIGWAILTYAVKTFMMERQRILWFVVITFAYLLAMEIWGEASIGFAYIRVLFVGLLLQALLSLPRLQRKYGMAKVPSVFYWKWIAISTVCVGLLVGLSGSLSIVSAERSSSASWSTLFEGLLQDYAVETAWFNLSNGGSKGVSGYSEEDRVLGGSVELSEDIIFEAKTPRLTYWRAESKAVYTGKGWQSLNDQEIQLNPDQIHYANHSLYDPSLEKTTLTQEVFFHTPVSEKVLFIGGELQEVRSLSGTDNMVHANASLRYNNEEQQWKAENGELSYYKVEVAVPKLDLNPADAAALKTGQAGLTVAVKEQYTQLPGQLPERVSLLAKRLTASSKNDWAKVEAIQQYLKEQYPYETNHIRFPDTNEDFVDQFLFETQVGYCDHFSTALAVMLRAVDVPARWVRGFAPGEADYDEETSMYHVTVRAKHAHAWVEVYLEGIGWLPVEATPGYSVSTADTLSPSLVQEEKEPDTIDAPQQQGNTILDYGRKMWTRTSQWVRDSFTSISRSFAEPSFRTGIESLVDGFKHMGREYNVWWTVGLAILLLPLYIRLNHLKQWYMRSSKDRLLLRFEKVWKQVFQAYGPLQANQTIREYVERVTETYSQQAPAMIEFLRMYENVRYGTFRHAPYTEQEIIEVSKKLIRPS